MTNLRSAGSENFFFAGYTYILISDLRRGKKKGGEGEGGTNYNSKVHTKKNRRSNIGLLCVLIGSHSHSTDS